MITDIVQRELLVYFGIPMSVTVVFGKVREIGAKSKYEGVPFAAQTCLTEVASGFQPYPGEDGPTEPSSPAWQTNVAANIQSVTVVDQNGSTEDLEFGESCIILNGWDNGYAITFALAAYQRNLGYLYAQSVGTLFLLS
jgi:hypothetical protein